MRRGGLVRGLRQELTEEERYRVPAPLLWPRAPSSLPTTYNLAKELCEAYGLA